MANMIGYAIREVGLKWNHDGLSLIPRTPIIPQSTVHGLDLCEDVEAIMAYFGFNYERWKLGFGDANKFYAYLTECNLYHFDNVRERALVKVETIDKERRIVGAFFVYAAQHLPATITQFNRHAYHTRAVERFGCVEALERLNADIEHKRQFGLKFNGHIVGRITGLQGKELGYFMSSMRGGQSEDEFINFILKSCTDVETFISQKFSSFNRPEG
jgi:hypothetical protein